MEEKDLQTVSTEYQEGIVVVKISTLKTLDGENNMAAIDLVRSIVVQSKYKIVYLYTEPLAPLEDQIYFVGDVVYKYKNPTIMYNLLVNQMICATNWRQVLTHEHTKNGQVVMAIVDNINDLKNLYSNTDILPIYIPRPKHLLQDTTVF